MTTADPRMYRSKLTRAEFDAIIAIEAVMAKQDCDGMFARAGGALPEALAEALADSMEAAGWLSSQWMEGYIEEEPHGGAAYWPTANARFLCGMCVGAELRGREVIFAETSTVSSTLMVARELAKNWGPLPMWLDADQRAAPPRASARPRGSPCRSIATPLPTTPTMRKASTTRLASSSLTRTRWPSGLGPRSRSWSAGAGCGGARAVAAVR